MSELGTYHGASTMMRKTLDWNRSRISMLEVEAANFYSIKPYSNPSGPTVYNFDMMAALCDLSSEPMTHSPLLYSFLLFAL
jgi:hypothetical protein